LASIFDRDSLSSLASSLRSSPALDRRGLSNVDIVPSLVGIDAGSIGGAALPLIKQFALDRDVLFQEAMRQAR
jgi:hypothetical protein